MSFAAVHAPAHAAVGLEQTTTPKNRGLGSLGECVNTLCSCHSAFCDTLVLGCHRMQGAEKEGQGGRGLRGDGNGCAMKVDGFGFGLHPPTAP